MNGILLCLSPLMLVKSENDKRCVALSGGLCVCVLRVCLCGKTVGGAHGSPGS